MGCAGSKDSKKLDRDPSRKYLNNAARLDNTAFGGGVYLPSTGPLTAKEYKERLTTSDGTQTVHLPQSGYTIRYAYVSQRGYYPDHPDKLNQDAFCVHTFFNGDPEQHFFGIFDGHGEFGTQSAQFARDKVPENFLYDPHFDSNPEQAFHNALVNTNAQSHRADFDDSMSGTTSINVLIRGRTLVVANVGDSRAVLAERVGGRILAQDLSIDQTPYRRDECERVRAAGARVQTLDQMEGLKDPGLECWTTEEEDGGDPPRLWFPNGMYPGTAFTRSIGDAAAERIGVFAEPELERRTLGPSSSFVVIASDGVFEFLSSQSVVDMVSKFDDPHEAALSVVAESYRLWLQYETRTDDITMVILQFCGLEAPPPQKAIAPGPAAEAAAGTIAAVTGGEALAAEAAAAAARALNPTSSFRERLGLSARVMDVEASDYTDDWTRQGTTMTSAQPSTSAPKSTAEYQVLDEATRSNFLFSHLSDEERRRVFDAMDVVHVKAGLEVIRQGERGDHFYIIQSGMFDVLVHGADGSPPDLVHTYSVEGSGHHPSFGEIALLYGKPRAASVIAKSDGSLWRLHRRDFKAVLQAQHGPSEAILHHLRSMELLQPLSMAQLQLLALLMERRTFLDGAQMSRQGELSDEFYVVESGQVSLSVAVGSSGSSSSRGALVIGPWQFFSEQALLAPHPRPAHAVAKGDVVLLVLSRQKFEGHFGPLAALIDAHAAWKQWLTQQSALLLQRNIIGSGHAADVLEGKFDPAMLECQRAIWATEYSCLAGVYHAPNDCNISARLFSVSAVESLGCGSSVARQRLITRALPPCLFAPHTIRAWSDPKRGFAGEALATTAICSLETLLHHLARASAEGVGCLPEQSVRYVAACVVLALEHLHYLGVAYRGLSAATVVLTEAGLVQLVDFRFARRCEGRAYTLCGAPEYMAPEAVEGTGHSDAVDWWALGVLIFHLLTGSSPFAAPGDDELRIYKRIVKGFVAYPSHVSGVAKDVIGQLLCRDPTQRLGAAASGVSRLRAHPFFGGIDWAELREGRTPLPLGIRESLFAAAAVEGATWDAGPTVTGAAPAWLKEF